MSIQFILGLSGTGKTSYLINEIINSGGEQKIFYIVPEPEVFCMQKKIIKAKKTKGLINIEVLSFEKLIYRIFEDSGVYTDEKMDKLKNNMILTKILLKNKSDNINKNYINEVSKTIKEFIKYNISPETLAISHRISDINKIYADYIKYTDNLGIIPEQNIEFIVNIINKSEILFDSVVVIDEFYNLSPFQMEIIKAILKVVKGTYIAMTMDNAYEKKFANIMKIIGALKYYAITQDIKVEKDIYLKQNKRYKDKLDLAHLEKTLLSDKVEKFVENTVNIHCYSTSNVYEEVYYIGYEIKRLVQNEDYRYKDIVVAYTNGAVYRRDIIRYFEKMNIPISQTNKDTPTNYSLIRFILLIYNIVLKDFEYESMNKYLKTNYTNVSLAEAALLEKYILEYGMSGYKAWIEESEDNIGVLKKKVMEPFITLKTKLEKNQVVTVKEYTEYLYEFLEYIEVRGRIKEKSNDEIYGEYNKNIVQIWNELVKALGVLVSILGDEKSTLEQYLCVLDVTINNITVDEKIDLIDAVLVEDISKIMTTDKKILFLLGVNDGYIPSKNSNTGLISKEERESLSKVGIDIGVFGEDKINEENIYLYNTLMKIEQKLYFSYSLQDSEGKSINQAMLITKLRKNFESLVVHKYDGVEDIQEQDMTGCIKEKYILSSETVDKIYPNNIYMSASRLQDYAMCPFKYFAKYNLGAEEKQIYRLQMLDIGKLYHAILSMFFYKVKIDKIDMASLNKEIIEGIVDGLIIKYIEENNIFNSSSKYKFITSNLKNILVKSILAMTQHIINGRFIPTHFEIGFGDNDLINPIKINVGQNKTMIIKGKIDRVDLLKEDDKVYVKVIDYKSGNLTFSMEDIRSNINMQLMLYMMAILEDKKFVGDFLLIPAGVFYFQIGNKKIKLEDVDTNNIEEISLKKYKMSGLVIGDKSVAKAMDSKMEAKSNIIPVELKQDGELGKRSSVLDVGDFYKLLSQVKENIAEIGREILEGNVEAKPYKNGNIGACDYCEYKDICGM